MAPTPAETSEGSGKKVLYVPYEQRVTVSPESRALIKRHRKSRNEPAGQIDQDVIDAVVKLAKKCEASIAAGEDANLNLYEAGLLLECSGRAYAKQADDLMKVVKETAKLVSGPEAEPDKDDKPM